MRYVLWKPVLGAPPQIEITSDEYQALETAHVVLANAFAIEEKYEIVVSNYLDLEKEILNGAADSMVRRTIDYSGFFGIRSKLNVRIVNLLTSAKLYKDQMPQHVTRCLKADDAAKEKVERYYSEEYDSSFEFRFMEALRNHVQHRGIAAHFLSQSGRTTSEGEDSQLEYTLEVAALNSYLRDDEKFKKTVLTEMPEKVDLVKASRSYVGSLSAINEEVRKMIKQETLSARKEIEEQHARYKKVYKGKTIGLEIAKLEDEEKLESTPMILDWDDVRLELQRRNPMMKNLNRRYVEPVN